MSISDRLRASAQLRWPWAIIAISICHLIVVELVIGLRLEHFAANLLIVSTGWAGGKARQFSKLCFPLWLVGASYELSGKIMFLQGDDPLIQGIYDLEMILFGIPTAQGKMILSEYFAIHNWPILDAICGFFYSFYFWHIIFVPMIWVFTCPERQPRMAWSFFVANMLGLLIFILLPVAPPWYVAQYGFEYVPGVPPSPAGAARFDALFGITYFQEFYKHNATVFGAMPSLHVGYPFAVALGTLGYKRGWQVYCFMVPTMVAFSAFYLQHHYILDILGGLLTGFVSFCIVIYGLHRKQWDGTLRGFKKLMFEVPEGYVAPH